MAADQDKIRCLPLTQVTDGPLFSAGPGTLSALTNMELRPGGYAEARGGFEELKPNGGTAADALSQGGFSDVHQICSSYGWVRTFNSAAAVNSQYSKNLQFDGSAWPPFPTGVASDAVYFGSDLPFSRVGLLRTVAASWTTPVFVYEYWNGSNFNTALTTAETFDWTTSIANATAWTYASWKIPTDWATTTIGDSGTGNVLKYWMRVRLSSIAALVTLPRIDFVSGNWHGMKEIYAVTVDPRTSATNGALKRHGQTGTTEEWFSAVSSLYSGSASPAQARSYRGRLFYVNGKEANKWDGASSQIGLVSPNFITHGLGALAAAVAYAGGLAPGTYRYYMAFTYGPNQAPRVDTDNVLQDTQPLYGASKALFLTTGITTAGNEQINLLLAGTIPTNVTALYIYRSDNVANALAAELSTFPAFLVGYLYRINSGTNLATSFNSATFVDTGQAKIFPPTEAIQYDTLPPKTPKFVAVYQNRLLLGDSDYWFWSEPFKPDIYNKSTNYISLARAFGGRHMGGVEFADQMVLFTEDQTWGLTNIDLDIPQLFPIALAVGCIAPDAARVVDGELIWPARDGFYAWDGNQRSAPRKISGKMKETFGKMNFKTHGGSKATGHNRRYDIRLSNPDYSTIGNAYRFNLDSGEWSTLSPTGFASTMFPVATVFAPLGNNDAGYLHSLWGKVDYGTGAGEYGLFLGELTTQDAGSNYTCSATMHFPLPPGALLTPQRVKAYYQASDGWGTPSFTNAVADPIGSGLGTLNTGTPDTGSDYSIIGGTFSAVGRGSSDHQVTFSVTSAAGGTVNRQRLFGGLLDGMLSKIRRGGV